MGEKNRHHCFWPKAAYKTPFEKLFRKLPCYIIVMDKAAHELLHRHSQPPKKPSRDEMVRAVNDHADGVCSCYSRQQTLPIKRLR